MACVGHRRGQPQQAAGQFSYEKHQAEMVAMMKQGGPKRSMKSSKYSTDQNPPNAVGNNQTVEVTTGEQTLNFDLRKPS